MIKVFQIKAEHSGWACEPQPPVVISEALTVTSVIWPSTGVLPGASQTTAGMPPLDSAQVDSKVWRSETVARL